MCGIAGIVEYNSNTENESRLEKIRHMAALLKNRGPDDEGYFSSEHAALGHTRLKIIDLESGSQPMFNENRKIALVYNGEIYNHTELRTELTAKGHTFSTRCDTEVIIHAYEEWGVACLERFNGMFAFGLWDEENSRLFLARDRLGIKPLFWNELPNSSGILFTSSINSLVAGLEDAPTLDTNALVKYLILQYVPSPQTIFRGINKLEPGHYLLFDRNGVQKKRYWNLPTGGLDEAQSNPERLLELLQDSVSIRLMSDVPIGAFLSGGIDSSSIVALMKNALSSQVQSFSVSFKDFPDLDESHHFKAAADFFSVDQNTLDVKASDMASRIQEAISASGEPVADPALLPTYIMSEFASTKVKVVLTGEGADELFGGYLRYKLNEATRKLDWLPSFIKKPALGLAPFFLNTSRAKKAAQAILASTEAARHIGWVRVFAGLDLAKLLPDVDVSSVEEELEDDFHRYFSGGLSGLNATLNADIATWLADDLLTKVDSMSMAHGLEARVPFLDHRIVEWAACLRPDLKINGNSTKIILKKAMQGIVPDNILDRKKAGFTPPLASWFRGELAQWVRDEIMETGEPFDPKELSCLIDGFMNDKSQDGLMLFSILAFKLWIEAAK